MLGLLRRKKAQAQLHCLPAGQRVYAVGDIHGRLDLLDALLHAIEADDAACGAAQTTIIFLGDLIDRGPESAQVIARLRTASPAFAECHFLMGNHEEAMLDAMEGDASAIRDWIRYGGDTTLMSYGVGPAAIAAGGLDLLDQMHARVSREDVRFLRRFKDSVKIGDYLFVHAGIRPGIALDEQSSRDMRWIRNDFLRSTAPHPAMIVHGHSISLEPEMLANRIGIDTGAYETGRLTALALEGDRRWVLQT